MSRIRRTARRRPAPAPPAAQPTTDPAPRPWTPERNPGRRLHDGAAIDSIELADYVAAISG